MQLLTGGEQQQQSLCRSHYFVSSHFLFLFVLSLLSSAPRPHGYHLVTGAPWPQPRKRPCLVL